MTSASYTQNAGKKAVSELLQHQVCSVICDMDFRTSGHRVDSPARFNLVQLGNVDVFHYENAGVQRGNRHLKHIRADAADYFILLVPLTANFVIRPYGNETRVLPGSFGFLSTARPFRVDECCPENYPSPDAAFASLHVRIPGPMLRQRVPVIDDLCNKSFDIANGAGRIMKTIIESALNDGPSLSERQSVKFGTTIADIVANAAEWADQTNSERQSQRELGLQRIHDRAMLFIEANLSSSALDSATVAEHCGVSLRYLQTAFEPCASGVATFIRERRLQCCRDALRSAALCHRTIGDIASTWGFNDLPHFSRLYRARFGNSPSEEREIFASASMT